MSERERRRLILPPSAGAPVSRRRVLQIGGFGAAGLVLGGGLLSACGGDDSDDSGATTTAGGGGTGTTGAPKDKVKIGFVYIGPIDDNGWTEEHHRGRQGMIDALGDAWDDSSEFVENVGFDPAQTVPIIERLAKSHDMVICNTEYTDLLYGAAEKFPDTQFLECNGHKWTANLDAYYLHHVTTTYAMGVAAALMNDGAPVKAGYIGAFPTATAYNDVNGLLLGARSINPDSTVQAVMISSFFDPTKATAAANALVDQDINFLFAVMDEPSFLQVANEAGVWAGAWNTDVREFGPDVYVNTLQLDFGPYYASVGKALVDGTYAPDDQPELLPLDLGEWGDKVPQEVRDQVDPIRQQLLDGSLNPYTGPLVDNKGNEVLAEGETIDIRGAYDVNWALEGVTGVDG